MRQPTRRTNVCGWAIVLALVATNCSPAAADDAIAVNERAFAIPVQVAAGDPEVAEVRLYCSTDAGRTWQLRNRAQPPLENFEFTATDDREYWFLVRTADANGRESSGSQDPELKVVVDTTPPQLELQADHRPTGECIVAWKIGDSAADADTLKLQYRAAGETAWSDVVASRTKKQGDGDGAAGTLEWLPPGGVSQFTLRIEAADLAGNKASKEIQLGNDPQVAAPATVAATATIPAAPPSAASAALTMPAPPRDPALPLYVNSLSFELDYDVDRVPASSIEKVELYGTRDDGINWIKLGVDADRRSPCTVNVEHEGRYGFAIVVEAAGGASGRAPREGETPEIRVIVDLTTPKARLTTAEPDPTGVAGSLKINWQASDQYLGPKAVSLAYSSSAHGPWLPLALGVPNDGGRLCSFDQQAPDNVYLRLEVRDEAGNLGAFSTTTPIPIEKRQVNFRAAGQGQQPRTTAAPKWFHVLR